MLQRCLIRGLLAWMLVFTGVYAVPAAHVVRHSAGVTREYRQARLVVEPAAAFRAVYGAAREAALPPAGDPPPNLLREHSLFQRPPPFLS